MLPRSRFQRPLPDSVNRSPSVPFGTVGSPVTSSISTVLNAAPSAVIAEIGGGEELVGHERARRVGPA